MQVFRERADHRWALDRVDGFVDMSTAENALVWDLLEPEMSKARSVPASAARYGDTRGSAAFRAAVAALAGRTFIGRDVDPDSICTLAGAGAVLEAVFHALCDPGDGVLVATPGYAGFWMDLETRDEVVIVPVPTRWEDGFRIIADALDRAFDSSTRPIRALLLSSPDNPTGRVLNRSELTNLVEWCRDRSIHLVSDEVYALSIHDGTTFTSVANVTDLGEDVHIVWSISKDFSVSGFRCGVLITENERLHRAVSAQAIWSGVSGRTEQLFAELLSDQSWTDGYLTEMRRRLADAHHVATTALDARGIRHLAGQAGFFVLVDLSAHLNEATFTAERDLWRRMVSAGVNLTPGEGCRSPVPGVFRMCFAATPVESLPIGVDRIASAVR